MGILATQCHNEVKKLKKHASQVARLQNQILIPNQFQRPVFETRTEMELIDKEVEKLSTKISGTNNEKEKQEEYENFLKVFVDETRKRFDDCVARKELPI